MNRGFSITDSGNCLLEGHLLHPGEAPLTAAETEISRLLDGGGPDDLLVLAGSGLGWHAKAALQKIQGPEVLLFEPDPLRLALMKCLGPDLNGVKIAPDEDSLLQTLANQLIYGGKDKVAVFSPEAYKQAAPQVAASARRMVDEAVSRRQTDQTTRILRHGQWLENLAANFKRVLEYPDLSLLAGVLPKTPAVILGAGPSLDESLPLLKGISQRALVVAAASALGPLGRMGGRAHVAAAIEAKDESRQFVGSAGENMLLAAALSSNPNHFEKWPGRLGFFHLQPWVAELIGLGQALPTGGHATSAAFSLAVLWGLDPIILVGQDLAYSQGRIHASGRPGGEDEKRPEIIQIPAIDGGMVETSPVMQSYVAWYQEAAAHLKGLPERPRIINATAQGALFAWFRAYEPCRSHKGPSRKRSGIRCGS